MLGWRANRRAMLVEWEDRRGGSGSENGILSVRGVTVEWLYFAQVQAVCLDLTAEEYRYAQRETESRKDGTESGIAVSLLVEVSNPPSVVEG